MLLISHKKEYCDENNCNITLLPASLMGALIMMKFHISSIFMLIIVSCIYNFIHTHTSIIIIFINAVLCKSPNLHIFNRFR